MIRRLLCCLLFLSCLCVAQNTNVTGTVTDPQAQAWLGGTFNFQLQFPSGYNTAYFNGVPLPVTQYVNSGVLDGAGAFSVTILNNAVIAPANTFWRLTLCSKTSSPIQTTGGSTQSTCFTLDVSVFGVSQNITGLITPKVPTPIVNTLLTPFAYKQAEVPNPTLGGVYWDINAGCLRVYNGVTFPCLAAGVVSTDFGSITGGTNLGQPLHVGNGSTLDATGTGSIHATLADSMPYSGNTAGSNLTVKTEGAVGSLSPATNTSGQIAGTQTWLPKGLVAPAASFATTGGSFLNGRATSIRYVLNSLLGPTTSSIATSGSNISLGCSTSTCQLTIIAPTIPAGYTGYSVYAQDCGATPCFGSETLQGTCANITTNCVINSVAGGSALPTANTAILQPPNVLNYLNDCPPGVIPSTFIPDASGNYRAWIGMNMGDVLPGQTAGTPTICFRTYFRDDVTSNPSFTAQTQSFKNAFVSINHLAGKFTTPTIQDRGLAVNLYNPATDSGTYWGWEGIQSEVDVTGTPTFNGSPDGEVSAGSFQLNINNSNGGGYGTLGPSAIRAQTFRGINNGGPGSCTFCLFGVRAIVSNQSSNTYSGGFIVAVSGEMNNSLTGTSITGMDFAAQKPGTRLNGSNFGYYVENFGTNTLDWNIFSQGLAGSPTAGRNWFGGNVYLPNIIGNANDIAVTGSLVASGSFSTAAFATPTFNSSEVGNQGVAGATTYSYKITGVDGNLKETAVSAIGTTTTGNATLNGSNFNRIILSSGFVQGIGHFNIYRTASGGAPASTGKIGVLTVTNSTVAGTSLIFDDTGLAGDSSTPPTQNRTGAVLAPLFITTTACASSGGTCSAAPAGFVSIAAAATTVTVSTTAVTALSQILIQEDATVGTPLSVTCNTTLGRTYMVTTRTAGTSFVITASAAPVTNPACLAFSIIN